MRHCANLATAVHQVVCKCMLGMRRTILYLCFFSAVLLLGTAVLCRYRLETSKLIQKIPLGVEGHGSQMPQGLPGMLHHKSG